MGTEDGRFLLEVKGKKKEPNGKVLIDKRLKDMRKGIGGLLKQGCV